MTSASVITILKSLLWDTETPVQSDNGPQFTSNELTQFAQEYKFLQVTSSPHYPQTNGAVERDGADGPGDIKQIKGSSSSYSGIVSDPNALVWTKPIRTLYGIKIDNNCADQATVNSFLVLPGSVWICKY